MVEIKWERNITGLWDTFLPMTSSPNWGLGRERSSSIQSGSPRPLHSFRPSSNSIRTQGRPRRRYSSLGWPATSTRTTPRPCVAHGIHSLRNTHRMNGLAGQKRIRKSPFEQAIQNGSRLRKEGTAIPSLIPQPTLI